VKENIVVEYTRQLVTLILSSDVLPPKYELLTFVLGRQSR